ncbi:hypothetical protein NW761_006188 [Fusarium oxysporum]|nr:hypothetical protein NW758_009305 [Fusarium oxysporum]KAJ4049027.1 hypothetical protein NW753_008026 [Fusarium oxysporum]KAJ4049610.1 hypothetical protein NW763_008908 [Fusarium oxysporum]KAJ4089905.1 hypothetical protein NW756_006241 [Fusarium oxysporum]KAJ4091975.1 hypothetical protein NW761_006188 [Fusarium oxysporum]
MSSTTSSAAAQTSTCEGGQNLYNTPVQNSLCAMPYGGNHTEIMTTCCGTADIVSYYDDCGIYCLASDKNVSQIINCLYENGAAWEDVFCKGNGTASGTATAIPTEASIIVTGGSSATGNKGSTKTTSSTSAASEDAAPGLFPQSPFRTVGFVIGSLFISATLFGTLQI